MRTGLVTTTCKGRLLMKTYAIATAIALAVATSTATADPLLQLNIDDTSPFLVDNDLMSVTISITGFEDGERVLGITGTPGQMFFVSTTHPDGFWNRESAFPFLDGESYLAGNADFEPFVSNIRFDSGFLDPNGIFGTPMGGPGEDVTAFARFSSGGITGSTSFAWMTLDPHGYAVDSNTILPVMRLTFNRFYGATFGFILVTDLGEYYYAIPSPGGLALLGLLAVAGPRRRR